MSPFVIRRWPKDNKAVLKVLDSVTCQLERAKGDLFEARKTRDALKNGGRPLLSVSDEEDKQAVDETQALFTRVQQLHRLQTRMTALSVGVPIELLAGMG